MRSSTANKTDETGAAKVADIPPAAPATRYEGTTRICRRGANARGHTFRSLARCEVPLAAKNVAVGHAPLNASDFGWVK